MKKLITILILFFVGFSAKAQIDYYFTKPGQKYIYTQAPADSVTVIGTDETGGWISYFSHVEAVDTIFYAYADSPDDTIATLMAVAESLPDSIRGALLDERGAHRRGITVTPRSNMYIGAHGTGAKPIWNGAEIITNWTNTGSESPILNADSDFSGSGWSVQAGWTQSGGVGVATDAPSNNVIYQDGIVTSGLEYTIQFDIVTLSEGGFKPKSGVPNGKTFTTLGTHKDTLTAGATWMGIAAAGTTNGTIDNVEFRLLGGGTESNIWVTPSPLDDNSAYRTVVVIDDNRFMPVDSLKNLDADLEFFAEDSVGTVGDSIYVYSATDPSLRTAELSTVLYGVKGLTASNVTIKDLDFRQYGYAGIDFRDNVADGNVLVDNCSFYFNRQTGVQFYNNHNNNTIQNSTATYNGNGFYANNSDDISFINNTVTNTISYPLAVGVTDGHGIGAYKANNTLIEGNYMENNQGSNIGYDTPSADFPNNGIIRYNTLKANSNGSGSCVGGNHVAAGSVLNVYYNDIYNDKNNNYAVSFNNNGGGKINIYNNTIVQSGEVSFAIRLNYADSIVFKNNIVFNAVGGATGGLLLIYYDGTPVSDNNLWYDENSVAQFAQRLGVVNYSLLSDWQTASSQDLNSIESDPLFTTEFTNLQLQTGSPAINAGVDVGLTKDINGNPIVGAPDIGAIEYQTP